MTITAQLHRELEGAGPHAAVTTLSNGRHTWAADVGRTLGSFDAAPDPHDLLDSALAACTVLTLDLYIRRKSMPVTALKVTVEHVETRADDGTVHYAMQRTLRIEGVISDADRARLLEIAGKCPIHRLLEGQTQIHTELSA